MTENTVQIDIPFELLIRAIASLEISKKQKLWEMLETELFEEDDPETLADIQAARADYSAGDYLTFDQYRTQRKSS